MSCVLVTERWFDYSQAIMIRKAVVFVLVFFITINANPISVADNKGGDVTPSKHNSDAVFSEGIDQKFIDLINLTLKRRGVVVEGSEAQDDKVTLMKKMLKRKISFPEAIETLSASQDELSSVGKVDLRKKFEQRIAQMKKNLPDNLRRNNNSELSEKFEKPQPSETLKYLPLTKPFKVPEYIKLPEKFASKLKVVGNSKPEKI